MLVSIHQPNLLPRTKILAKIALSDLWIVLDDVQFSRSDYQNRAYIHPTARDQPPRWLTIPVHLQDGRQTPIKRVASVERGSALGSIRAMLDASFPGSPESALLIDSLSAAIDDDDLLVSLGVAAVKHFLVRAGAHVPRIVRASAMRTANEPKTAGIAQLLHLAQAHTYIADTGAYAYLDVNSLEAAGMQTLWQVWKPIAATSGLDEFALRNGSALNLLERDPPAFRQAVRTTLVSRTRTEVEPCALS